MARPSAFFNSRNMPTANAEDLVPICMSLKARLDDLSECQRLGSVAALSPFGVGMAPSTKIHAVVDDLFGFVADCLLQFLPESTRLPEPYFLLIRRLQRRRLMLELMYHTCFRESWGSSLR